MDTEKEDTMTAYLAPAKIPSWRFVFDRERITEDVLNEQYEGAGTAESPYIVTWIHRDQGNPLNWSLSLKWWICAINALVTFTVALNSSAFSGSLRQLLAEFKVSTEVITLGISLFVLGFAIGPLVWAPLSEMYGRQIVLGVSYGLFTAFNIGAANAHNIETLLIMRFFAGACGSSPFTNAGGAIADVFSVRDRGLAMALFAACPSLGPTLGPMVGGFLGESKGWRWVQGLMAILSGILWIVGLFTAPETYGPVLLHLRAVKLSKITGKVYKTSQDIIDSQVTVAKVFRTSLSRPLVLLIFEPIVLLLSIYMAIIYGTLYLFFGAYPIVYQAHRGWSEGIGGLAFLGLGFGMMAAIVLIIIADYRMKKRYQDNEMPPEPEARLKAALIGSFALPIGIFWFAWTNSPSVHWMVSIAAGAPFGFGMVMVFLSITSYLVDSYTIFAASALAANSVLRSLFGAAFPLFTEQMYDRLGIHWASAVPGFLALGCVPFPFLFYKYGGQIRRKCRFAAEAAAFRDRLSKTVVQNSDTDETGDDVAAEGANELRELRIVRTKTYEASPFDIDRVNTAVSIIAAK